MTLAAVRARVDPARAEGGEALASALLDLAEAEPIFGHRQAVVRGLLDEAATLLDQLGRPALEGRTLLRLAYVKLSEGDLEAVEQLAPRARDRLAPTGDTDRLIEADTLLVRSTIRRRDFAAAQAALIALTERAGDVEPTTLTARRAAAGAALAWAELALEQADYSGAQQRFGVLADAIAAAEPEELIDIEYGSAQARSVIALALGQPAQACTALRAAVVIAKQVGALEDELETRVALAGLLVQRGDTVGEAEKHLQITRDQAIEHGLDSMHMAALVGQAGLLAQKGQTHAALDRCLEIAQTAIEKRDPDRYGAAVALMSQIYEQKGDLASAYRTLAEANAALRDSLGDQAAKAVIRPHLAAFAARIGPEKLDTIAAQVNAAAHARKTFRRT